MQNIAFLSAEMLQRKRPYIYSNLYYNITPYSFCKPKLSLQFLFCYKIKYVNLGLFIWLFYFDIVDTLMQFIERNSDHAVSKSMLLIISFVASLVTNIQEQELAFKKNCHLLENTKKFRAAHYPSNEQCYTR